MTNGLYSWQEPFREFFGKRVRITSVNGRIICGTPEIPRIGHHYALGRGKGTSLRLLIKREDGEYQHLSVDKIKSVEVIA